MIDQRMVEVEKHRPCGEIRARKNHRSKGDQGAECAYDDRARGVLPDDKEQDRCNQRQEYQSGDQLHLRFPLLVYLVGMRQRNGDRRAAVRSASH